MSELGDLIGGLLREPQQLQALIALAGAAGGGDAPAGESEQAPEEASVPSDGAFRRWETLLRALLPFLKPDRGERLRRALDAARLTGLAGRALGGGPAENEK